MPEFNPELKKFNLEMGRKLEANGVKVIYVKIEKLKPKKKRMSDIITSVVKEYYGTLEKD